MGMFNHTTKSRIMNITLADKTFKPFIDAAEIEFRIEYIAEQLNYVYAGLDKRPILLVVLNGAVPFAMDLIKQLKFDFDLDFVKVSSYQGEATRVNGLSMAISGPELDPKGREVILIEDIVDSGQTIHELARRLTKAGASHVATATLLLKPAAYVKYNARKVEFVGSCIEDKFIVGYGMDYKGLGRGLKEIYQLVDEPVA